jgi:phosphotransferase system enzyme I (PtsP)
VTLCGELASTPLGALALIGLGYRSLSLVPSAIGPVKAMLLELDSEKAAALVSALMAKADGLGSVRDKLAAFAAAEGLPV